MNNEDKEFWEWAAPKLRREYGHRDMMPEEIEAFLDTVEDEELPPRQIERILESIREALRFDTIRCDQIG